MFGSEFANTLRRSWRQILMWGGVLGAFGFLITVIIQDVDALKQYAAVMEDMPPALMQAFGVSSENTLATPEGYIAFGAFLYGAFIMAAFGVAAGTALTINDEENGILDMVLSLPIPRWRIIAERFAAYIIVTFGIAMLLFAGLFIGGQVSAFELDYGRIFASCVNLLPFTMLTIAVTALLATLLQRQGTVIAVAAVFVIGSYLLNFLGSSASDTILADLQGLSYFYYFDSEGTMMQGIAWGNFLGMVAVALALIGASVYFFDHRNVGV
ncbi:ABC transporter permease subunit [Phototrophicus methaneseepsis]|uniref:ABC transporter permease subunit n=1 Tax=Phototrophicus methaneseepsis TaxID=2710758 RepID=A0A7S8IFJ0_9CHLR|nr:ABC transporter permease subunit [Phototrophicus methaneseepsis]QPC84780.1 ABC transporter permease subunit [Phototrophicus methaneseepsis]